MGKVDNIPYIIIYHNIHILFYYLLYNLFKNTLNSQIYKGQWNLNREKSIPKYIDMKQLNIKSKEDLKMVDELLWE